MGERHKSGSAAVSNFPDYAGPLTEMVQFGSLAVWAAPEPQVQGPRFGWDARRMRAQGAEHLERIVHPTHKLGYPMTADGRTRVEPAGKRDPPASLVLVLETLRFFPS